MEDFTMFGRKIQTFQGEIRVQIILKFKAQVSLYKPEKYFHLLHTVCGFILV